MLFRASKAEVSTSGDGRTLEGVAFYFDKPSKVTDDGSTFYLESFSRASVQKTLRERGRAPLPLGYLHPWSSDNEDADLDSQIGNVRFNVSEEENAVVYKSRLFPGATADKVLAEFNENGLDNSVGFVPYQQETINDVVTRTEIGLVELSLAPTGAGQHSGAQVMSVRAVDLSALRQRRLSLLLPPRLN